MEKLLQFRCMDELAAIAKSSFIFLFVVPVETKLGKNRTEAEVKRYSEERERLEKEKEEIRFQLAQLRKEKRELKEMLSSCAGKAPFPIVSIQGELGRSNSGKSFCNILCFRHILWAN